MVDIIRAELMDGIAGYSRDGARIYIDPSVPEWMLPCVVIHEETEMPLVLFEHMPYPEADDIATEAEKKACEERGISWKIYDAKFRELMHSGLNPYAEDPRDIHEGEKHGSHIVEKYNHNHGWHGRFATGGAGGGAGGTIAGSMYKDQIKDTMDNLAKDYPALTKDIKVEYVDSFRTSKDKDIRQLGDAYAAWWNGTMYVNHSEMSKASLINTLKLEESKKWTSPGTGNIKGVVEHEFGHAVFDTLEASGRKDGNIAKDLYSVMDIVQKHPTSEYGKTDVFEGFAESFAAMRAGKMANNDAVKAVQGLVTKYRGVVQ